MASKYLSSSWVILTESKNVGTFAHALLALIIYLCVVGLLRKQRLRSARRKYELKEPQSYSSMTLEDAFKIQKTLAELEFPFMFQKGLQFALFRTYGIPSISNLLVKTRQLTDPATACKRYVDTEVLVAEFLGHHPQSERTIAAIARTNYLHSLYRTQKAIMDEDMLYTLSLFALEPARWIDRYEWRKLEAFERNALGTFWKAMGDAMQIPYEGFLDSAEQGWVNGLNWLNEIQTWAEKYEEAMMKPSHNNHKTADETVALLLWYMPNWAETLGKRLVCTLMDERLRIAMM